MKIGLQLYSIRDSYQNQEEFQDSLRQLKAFGYDGVEFAGYAGFQAEEMKNFLKEIGLEPIASHHGIDDFDQNLEEILEYDARVGCKTVVCAYAPTSNLAEVEHLVTVMHKAKEAAKAYGMEVAYHNHSHEFNQLEDGSVPMDHIKKSCNLELDTYWVFHADVEPCSYIKDSADQISLIHLKDGDLEGVPCALGEGRNDIKGIIEASKAIGMEWIIVENDDPVPDGLSDVKRSMEYLKSLY